MNQKPFYISFLGLNPVELQVLQVAVGLLRDDGLVARIVKKPSWNVHLLVANLERTDPDNMFKMAKNIPVKLIFTDAKVTEARIAGAMAANKNTVIVQKPIRVLAVKEVLAKILRKLLELHINEKRPLSFAEPELIESVTKVTTAAPSQPQPPKANIRAAIPAHTPATLPTPISASLPTAVKAKPKLSPAAILPEVTAAATPLPTPKLPPRSKPNEKNFFELLWLAKQEQRCFRCKSQNGPSLIVDGQTKTISHSHTEAEFDRIYDTPPSSLSINFLEQAQNDPAAKVIAMDSVLWKAAIRCSNGKIIEGHPLDLPVTLRAWPNFTRQSFDPAHLKLAALLAKESMSVNKLSHVSQVPVEDVINFYNAAFVVNLIERRSKPREESQDSRKASPAIRDIISRLAKRLRIQ